MKDFINNITVENLHTAADLVILGIVAATAVAGNTAFAIAGLAIYFMGQHPGILGRK